MPEAPPAPVNPDAQAMAYLEAKRQIANRVIIIAAAIAFATLAIAGTALVGAMFMLSG